MPKVVANVHLLAAAGRTAATRAARRAAARIPTTIGLVATAVFFVGRVARLGQVFEANLQVEVAFQCLGEAVELRLVADELQDRLLAVEQNFDVEDFQGQALAAGRWWWPAWRP